MTDAPPTAAEISGALDLPPQDAIEFFRAKGYLQGFAWQDVWQGEHAKAFTVAKAMSQELLETIRQAVDDAIANGTTLEDFRAQLTPQLQAAGWWGRRPMIDPLTGLTEDVQLGSPRRLRIIFDVNLRTAYAAGRWKRATENRGNRPFMRYVAVMDDRTRPEHRAWHGTILPIDHPWWGAHFPPCGWNCRCTTTTLDQRTIDRRGWKVTEHPIMFAARSYRNPRTGQVSRVPGGIDPGFAYNVGEAYLGPLMPPPLPAASGPATAAALATSPANVEGAEANAAVAAFLAAFGLKPTEEQIYVDPQGWPLAIGPSLFVDPDGQFVPPPADRYEALAAAGRVVASPAQIRWVFVPGADGRQQLVRRYIGQAGRFGVVADFGRQGWRFSTPADRGGDPLTDGIVVWPHGEDAVPASH